jgi:hypothetical protein
MPELHGDSDLTEVFRRVAVFLSVMLCMALCVVFVAFILWMNLHVVPA